jgi:hypothetical protein
MSSGRKIIVVGIMVVMLLVVGEGMFFVAGKLLQKKWAMWRVPTPVQTRHLTYAQYRESRDPVLGWPYPKQYGQDLDVNGAQRNPYFPIATMQSSCVSLYGDSFTEGGDTSSRIKNWGNVLSHLSSCYVANFGMGGYGTDQAYLRFEANRDDPSPVVILGFHTDDVLRNLTRNRDLLVYLQWYALKPRFVLNAQRQLQLVPIPDLTEEEYLRSTGIAGDLLPIKDENFQPGGPAGVVSLEFPFTVSVTKNMLRFYGFRSKLLHQPEWMSFLAPGHPLHALEIVVEVSRKFIEVAHQRAKTPVVIVLPHSLDFAYFQNHSVWPYQTVLDGYARGSIPYIDFGPYLLASAKKEGKTFKNYFGATGHYNDEGNARVAQFVHDWLVAQALVPLRN